ncbi:hypothetical protein N9L18_00945 [Candidatus Pacebacteria bacterium]|nr:hypothetical protein [Candidatus Paceibacterota bacterium]
MNIETATLAFLREEETKNNKANLKAFELMRRTESSVTPSRPEENTEFSWKGFLSGIAFLLVLLTFVTLVAIAIFGSDIF